MGLSERRTRERCVTNNHKFGVTTAAKCSDRVDVVRKLPEYKAGTFIADQNLVCITFVVLCTDLWEFCFTLYCLYYFFQHCTYFVGTGNLCIFCQTQKVFQKSPKRALLWKYISWCSSETSNILKVSSVVNIQCWWQQTIVWLNIV